MKKVKMFVFLVLSLCFTVFIASAEEANAADMHRLYNPNSGEHFYTANGNEKNHLVKVGWKYEGIGWTAPATGNAVYRLYNANAGDHHYTLNANEKNHLVKVGWKYEGIGWYSDVKKAVPLYRAYNPNAKAGSHNYTVNYAEQKNLIRVGWRDEGIAWYGINKSTPVTKYTVTVKHVGSDGKTLNTSTASVEKGKSYTAKAGSFSGYTLKGSNAQTVTVNGNKTITFNYTKNAAPVTKYTITVKYVDTANNVIKPATTASVEKGKSYTATAPSISGYTLKGSSTQKIASASKNETLTFTYTKNAVSTPKHTVTIKYTDIKGNELAKSTTVSVEEGKSYTAKAVDVNGYTVTNPNSRTVTVHGNMTVTFTYLKNDSTYYTITVKYVDETGHNVRPASRKLLEKGDSYVAEAIYIPDYTVKGNKTQTISSVSKDETLAFVYTENTAPVTNYTITVNYVDEAGISIKTATTTNVEKGKSYKIDAPGITGYTVVAADKTKSIASVSKNETLTIKYTKNKYTITIKYVDGNGTSIKTATTQTVEHGQPFSMTAPSITGYTVKDADKTKTIASVSKNETVTFNYTKDAVPVTKYKITVKYEDEAGNTIKTATSTDIEKGKPFSMTAPVIGGYTVLDSDKTKSIGSVTKNETVTFKYKKNKYIITINYVDEGNATIKPATTQSKEHGESFSMVAPTITGYTVEPANESKYIGSVTKNETVTFKYKKNAVKYNVKIIHKGNDDTIRETENFQIEAGTNYSAKAKRFNGYVLTGKDTQNVLINKDEEIIFNYNNLAFHKVTLHGVLDGKIVKTVTFRVTPGEEFEPTGKKLDLDPKVYDVSKYSYWPKFTAVGGKSDEFRLQVWLFKNYLSDSELKIMQQTILQRVNELRKSLGREPLIEHPQLNAAATVRSKELNERLAHIRPDGRDIITAITDEKLSIIGYPGENIAYEGRPEFLTSGKLAGDAMFEGWEASEGHYLNMIDPDYKYFGVGVYCHGSFVYGTQLFIRGIR